MTRILVTGANGQLGKCLQDVAVVKSSIIWDFVDSKELDITSPEAIEKAFSYSQYDYLINCAAYTAVDKAEEEEEKAFLVNATGVKYLAEACEKNDTILIHISTDFVFDGAKNTPYTEEDIPNPINVYGASKLKGEIYVQETLSEYFIIRTSWVYSEYGHNFVKTMLSLVRENDEINVVNDQFGNPTYAKDLAIFLVFLVSNREVNQYGIYHFSNKNGISWYEFAKKIFSIKQSNVNLAPIDSSAFMRKAKRPKNSRFSLMKVEKILGFNTVNWNEKLHEVLNDVEL